MSRLFDAYRAFHDQGFIPIFVDNGMDSRMLVEACIDAGVKGIEYTLRRSDAHEMIPRIRENFPELYVLAGSTLDDETIVNAVKSRYPQLLTIPELDSLGVDGFVSMVGWSEESIRRYSPRRLIIPSAGTITEAFRQVAAGAHFIKFLGDDLPLVKRCRYGATFDFCPVMVTGGMTLRKVPEAIDAGAMLIGSGFDLILNGESANVSGKQVVNALKRYLAATREARAIRRPEMARTGEMVASAWLDTLPHHHPFQENRPTEAEE